MNDQNTELAVLLEREIEAIKERNAKVEADKAWETSVFRIGTICAITYIVAAIVLWLIGSPQWWLNAFVPTIGFYLSTSSMPVIKSWWIESRYRPD